MDKYLITGATGYIGSTLIKFLLAKGNDVTAMVRSRQKAETILPPGIKIICADITDSSATENINEHFDYIIHTAAVTTSSIMVSRPVETADSIVLGTKNILELARRANIKSMVYLSSMEVFGQVNLSNNRRAAEKDLGFVDICNPRSCYPMGKRMAEHYCYAYFKEYDLPVKIARLAQTFGKGVDKSDNRVFAQFAKAVLTKTDIVLHTDGMSMGNYCDIEDAINALFTILHHGENGEAYNIANESLTMRVKDMAELVSRDIANGQINVKYETFGNDKYGYPPPTEFRLSAEKIKRLGWRPKKNMIDMYRDMLETWKVDTKD